MIGSKYIEIGARSDGVNDFLNGITTGPETADGGFSSDTDGANLTSKPGVLMPQSAVTDASTGLGDEIIASAEDPTYLGSDRVFVDLAGKFYTWNGSALTEQADSSATFALGTTDFVAWADDSNGLRFYATNQAGSGGDIVRWDKSTGVVNDWWTSASHRNQAALSALTAWRPLLVFEKSLYIGDKNKLHRVTPALATSNGLLTLDANETISALGIDNNSGNILIGVTTGVDYSGLRNGRSKIYQYDGFSNKAFRVCEVNGVITSFLSVGPTTYVFYGNKFGVFNGSGIRFIRKLRFTNASANLVYKHKACVIDDTVYIAENASVFVSTAPTTILAYGPLQTLGQNVFYPVVSPATVSQPLTMLCSIGGNKLGFSYSSAKFATYDLSSVSAVHGSGQNFFSRWYRFPSPIMIQEVRIEFETPIAADAGNEQIGILSIKGDATGTVQLQVVRQDVTNAQYFVATTVGGFRTNAFRLSWTNSPSTSSDVYGVTRFVVYYDPIE